MTGSAERRMSRAMLEALRLDIARIDLRNYGRTRSEYVTDELFFELVRIAQPSLFVEAGAKDAVTSIRAAELLSAARVIACEANPENHSFFAAQLDHAGSGVDYRAAAVAAQPGVATFHVPAAIGDRDGALAGTSSLLVREVGMDRRPETADFTTVTVPSVTLDCLLHEGAPGTRTAAWVDVEGASAQVLSGGAGFLDVCDVLKIEVETEGYWRDQWLELDVCSHLVAHGLVPVARDLSGDTQYNLVFVSERLLGDANARLALLRYSQALHRRELPGLVGRARRHERVRSLARGVRAVAHKVKGRS